MTPFILLVDEHLEPSYARMLKSILSSTNLLSRVTDLWCFDWPAVQSQAAAHHTRYVLSVGKHALDQWHQWGLIQVGAQHGNVFEHRDARGDTYVVMVVEHPGTLMQQNLTGRSAKANMKMDLRNFAARLEGYAFATSAMTMCGRCQNTRVKGGGGRTRGAAHWPDELDCAGLCSEHHRTRGKIKSRWKKVRVDRSKAEAQIAGQMEMLPGDGTRLLVPKS